MVAHSFATATGAMTLEGLRLFVSLSPVCSRRYEGSVGLTGLLRWQPKAFDRGQGRLRPETHSCPSLLSTQVGNKIMISDKGEKRASQAITRDSWKWLVGHVWTYSRAHIRGRGHTGTYGIQVSCRYSTRKAARHSLCQSRGTWLRRPFTLSLALHPRRIVERR